MAQNGSKLVSEILNKQLKQRGDIVNKLEKQGLKITGKNDTKPNSIKRKLEKAMAKTDSKDELLRFGVKRNLLSLVKINIEVEPVGAVIEGVYILPTEVVGYIQDNANIIKNNGDVGEFLEVEYGVKDDNYTLHAKVEYDVKLTDISRVSDGVYDVGGNKLTKTDVFIGDNHWLVNDILFTRDHKDFMNYTRRYIDEYVREDEQATFILEDFIEYLDQSKLENETEQAKEDIRNEFKNQTKEDVLMELYRVRNNLTEFGLEQIWDKNR